MPVIVAHALSRHQQWSEQTLTRNEWGQTRWRREAKKKEPERRTVCYVYFDIHSFESVLMLLMRNYEMGLCFFPLSFACVVVFVSPLLLFRSLCCWCWCCCYCRIQFKYNIGTLCYSTLFCFLFHSQNSVFICWPAGEFSNTESHARRMLYIHFGLTTYSHYDSE